MFVCGYKIILLPALRPFSDGGDIPVVVKYNSLPDITISPEIFNAPEVVE